MKGISLTFTKQVANGKDALNNDTHTTADIVVDNCLVAPMAEPITAREQQAVAQSKDQVRVHLPKTCTDDVSNSTFVWDGKTFKTDSDSVKLMDNLTPGDWNRYFRAEVTNE